MPMLPSGKRLWLSMEAVLSPNRPFYPLPEGHFWYRDIDPTYGWLATPEASPPPEYWNSAIVPRSRVEAARFVRVLVGETASQERAWQGDWLVAYRRPIGFTEADWTSCLEFFGSSAAIDFLDRVIRRCRTQSEGLKHVEELDFDPTLGTDGSMTTRLVRAAHSVEKLDELQVLAESIGDERVAEEIRGKIAHIELVAEEALGRPGPHHGVAHRVLAACAAILGMPENAAWHGCEAVRIMPEDIGFPSRLAVRLRRAGHHEEALALSRKSLQTKATDVQSSSTEYKN